MGSMLIEDEDEDKDEDQEERELEEATRRSLDLHTVTEVG